MANVTWDTKWDTNKLYGTVGSWPLADVESGNAGGFGNDDLLGTAVLLSLFTDARLPDYMIGIFDFTINDQREWHGNTFAIDGNEEPLGSLLWTLRRAPMTNYTCKLAEHFCSEALLPLIRQGLASYFDINARLSKNVDTGSGQLTIHITAHTPEENTREFVAELFAIK